MLIAKVLTGSRLHGLSEENSDWDFTEIHMPEIENFYSGNLHYVRAIKRDKVDTTSFSLGKFLDLAIGGQAIAMDVLSADDRFIFDTSDIFEELRAMRHGFFTRKMKAMVGFAKAQAVKYGVKGDRFGSAKAILEIAESIDPNEQVSILSKRCMSNEHVHKGIGLDGVMFLSICGRQMQYTAKIGTYIEMLRGLVASYGKRAESATDGADFKALSHAIRVALVYESILKNGDFKYPLTSASTLKEIRRGTVQSNLVRDLLDLSLERIEAIEKTSKLPESVDTKAIMEWRNRWYSHWLSTSLACT